MEKKLTWKKIDLQGGNFKSLQLQVVIEERELDSYIWNLCFQNIVVENGEKDLIFEEFKEKNKEFFEKKKEIFSICHRRYGVGTDYCYFITVSHLLHILESVVVPVPCED